MNIPYNLFISTLLVLSAIFWLSWWFKLLLLSILFVSAILYHFIKIHSLKNLRLDLERQVLEKNELLIYSAKNEQKATEKALFAERNKGALLSRINHELRTPMNGVMGMATLLNETDLTVEQQEYVNTIVQSGGKLMSVINEIMVNDILEYSKTESGRDLEANDIDLSNCIEEVLDVFAVKAATAGIDLLYEIKNNVPKQVIVDVRRLRQILMNLIENSLRVTSKGEVFIGVQLLACEEDNRIKLEFEVRDTGTGMPSEQTTFLMQYLSEMATSDNRPPASGVGLIICKKLVALMGGEMQLKSAEGKGTTVTFSIYSKAGMQPSRSALHAELNELAGKKILVADDNATLRDLVCGQLESLQMETTSAASGKEALEILTQVSFDLIVTDLTMPEMNGLELAQCIRTKYPQLPVILLNPVTDEQYKEHGEILGAVISKPVKPRLLLDAITNQLRNKNKTEENKQNKVHKLSINFSKQYPLNILIAEDNPVNQKWTTKILSKLGYNTELANNGKEVLELVSTSQYDLILMDVQMPEMDGLEATRMIRLCLEVQPVIIAMTANVMQGDRQDCMQSGMDDYISKPVELNELMGMLEKWALLINEKKNAAVAKK
ncbi:MAG: hybrid sensor histidine kinase/response regulator [Ferruginibacter sp.]|nr:hybrid sensor histidine kinase/response regulator [Ferruginibacter sp.]